MPKTDSDKKVMQIKVDDKVLQGVYSNAMRVQYSKEEFVIDFLNIFPHVGTLNARIIVTPGHLKRLIAALSDNMSKYERNFGNIDPAQQPGDIELI